MIDILVRLLILCMFGGNVESMELNSHIEKVDWRGGDIWSKDDVAVLFVNAVVKLV